MCFIRQNYLILHILKSRIDSSKKLVFIYYNNEFCYYKDDFENRILITRNEGKKMLNYYLDHENYKLYFSNYYQH